MMLLRAVNYFGAVAVVVLILPLLLIFTASECNAVPLQFLPEIPGYIPVYIRQGDQPLEEIHPALAEAFREQPKIDKTIPEKPQNKTEKIPDNLNKDLTDLNDISLSSQEELSKQSGARLLKNLKPNSKDSVIMKISRSLSIQKNVGRSSKEMKQMKGNK
ncbi:hypothetical protein QAD02_001212 [Eretmocerus hayati]|uniref:Uncharacterized protein n=1 Tax=Eretmocerus hayati TaxID=131215 RepID=A0ACC2NFL7_9HYME|nr:hypothetical protein QAD02_001212 [Eretmocerus hayati]